MKTLLRYVPAFLAGALIFLGLPLLGWGLGHIPQFFENPARTAYAIMILAPFSDQRSFGVIDVQNTIRFVGLFITVPAFVLMQAGEKFLAKQFSVEVTLQKDHQLIQSRPYKVIRHPRYLAFSFSSSASL